MILGSFAVVQDFVLGSPPEVSTYFSEDNKKHGNPASCWQIRQLQVVYTTERGTGRERMGKGADGKRENVPKIIFKTR